ncbi:MAG: MFS transporter [Proteobacteria bacterium]|nr:MFS transporter [Pseudomonadota bacterium]
MIKNRVAIIALLTGLNFLNYIDRMVLAAVLPKVELEFGLKHWQSGLLATAFLIGYFATSPWFGARADRGARKGLIAFGVLIWSLATIGSGLSTGLISLIIARIVVGVGEASFATLGPTLIDDLTTPERKGKALAVFYLAIPVGSALGYLIGGYVGEHWGWRSARYVAGVPGLVLAATCLLIVEPHRQLAVAKGKVIDGLRTMAKLPLFRRATLGYIMFTAALGAFSFFAPVFLVEKFPKDLDLAKANFWFGVVTVAAGAIGTIVGGRWADASQRGLPPMPAGEDAYLSSANRTGINALLRICALGMCLATPLSLIAFFMPSPAPFFAVVFVIQLGLFVGTAPINAALLRAVPNHMRASSMAASIFAIHLFGDLWSPPALGGIVDGAGQLAGMAALAVAFAGAAYVWWPRAREAT